MIPFNKPYLTGKENHYIYQAVNSGKISGNGIFTQKCHQFFESKYGFLKCLLTTSCTDALEMAAILCDLQPDDEVIVPSYTFVSSANAFVLRGAKVVFADSCSVNPNIDASKIESRITKKTKAIVVVHYAGIACDMELIRNIASTHGLYLIEDAAQAIDSYYKDKPLGSFGDFATFSFHETKNIIAGEGGMLVINNPQFIKRAEIIWEKGTNRAAFWRGEIDKYNWVDIGSSYLPSEVISAFLYAQLEHLELIQSKRIKIWNTYFSGLKELEGKGFIKLPNIPNFARHNAHMFYVVVENLILRDQLISYLKNKGIYSVFHYISLHKSPFYISKYQEEILLPNSEYYSDTLLRLPLFYELSIEEVKYIVDSVKEFFFHK